MVLNIDELNRRLHSDKKEFILECDNNYFEDIKKIASTIKQNIETTPIILLSGPSGSGKTTSALSIERILDNDGFETHAVALDNYFLPLSEREKEMVNEDKLDLESPDRVDKDLLNTQLEKMVNCEAIELPRFDFKTASREFDGKILKRKPNEPVILEGIHSLNPDVIQIPNTEVFKIYVSVRKRVQYGSITVHPQFIRLLRRMTRDNIYRGRTINETIRMFESVEVGAEKYIMPYKPLADVDIDTFIPYELAVYRNILYQNIKDCDTHAFNDKIQELLHLLSASCGLDQNEVPTSSLIREFIGNGHFEY